MVSTADILARQRFELPATTQHRHLAILGVEPQSIINFRKHLVQLSVEAGLDVSVVSQQANADQLAAMQALGASIQSVRFARAGMNPRADSQTCRDLTRLFRKIKPDAVIAYTSKPIIFGLFAAYFARVPLRVALVTGLGYAFIDGPERKRKIARFFASLLYRLVLPRCTAVIFQNPDDRDEFRRIGLLRNVKNVSVVNGSGVDINLFSVTPLPDKPVFLMIARLLADKGTREYAQAASIVLKLISHASFKLVGPLDPSPNSIRAEEVKIWQANGIEYLGELADVRDAITSASVIVLPSYREGTPRSVLEGMAMGRAIITTDVAGCRETVNDGENGLLVAPRNAKKLEEAMLHLANDRQKIIHMGKASRRIAEQRYDAAKVAFDTLIKAGILNAPS